MNGLLLKDNEILNAMEMGLNGRFIPVYLTKTRKLSGTASALNEPELQIVLRYVERLMQQWRRSFLLVRSWQNR